jgi:hypothetical protein
MNEDEVVKDIQQLYGVNPKYVRDPADVEKIRQAKAEAQAQANQQAVMAQGLTNLKTGAEAASLMQPQEKSGK